MSKFLTINASTNLWLTMTLIIGATVTLAFLLSQLMLWSMRKVTEKTVATVDDRLYRLLERYLFPLLAVGGLLLVSDFVPLPVKVLELLKRSLTVVGLLLAWYLLAKGALISLARMEGHSQALRNIGSPLESATKIFFIIVGGMMVLDNLGISLTPIITTLGIGSLAVAIALQDTLGNLFAGLYINADRPIRIGDYIRLENGQEGYVDKIGWRSSHIRALQNNTIVVPNSKLAQTIITNFHLPEKPMALLIPVSVSYDVDPQRVEEILVEEAKKAVGEVEGLLGHPEPFVRFIPGFGDVSLGFTLICQVREFVDQYWVQHELRKRIFKRFEKEGMQEAMCPLSQYPFPQLGRSLEH